MDPEHQKDWARRRAEAEQKETAQAARKPEVVKKIQAEAKAAGATLASGGKGGLDPELALAVFRRDKFRCRVPGCKTPQEKLDLDHVSGHPKEIAHDPEADAWLKKQAKKPKRDNMDSLNVLCLRHHDLMHQRERAIEDGKEVPPSPKK